MEIHEPPNTDSPPPTEAPPKPHDARQSVEPPWMALAERGVAALEALAQDPVIHMETQPPVCPHCEEMNPIVEISAEANSGTGPLGSFVLKCTCLRCSNVLYMLPTQMESFRTIEEVTEIGQERNAQRGFDSGQSQGT